MGMSPQEARDTVLESSNSSVGNLSLSHDQSPDLSYDQSVSRCSSVSRQSSQDSAFGDKKPGTICGKIFEVLLEQRWEKTCLQGFRPSLTQTSLYSHRRWLEV